MFSIFTIEDPLKLMQAKAQIDTMMQQLDPTWNPHQKLEFFKLCVRTTLSQIGQITGGFEQFFSQWYLYRNRYKCVESETCYERYHEKKILRRQKVLKNIKKVRKVGKQKNRLVERKKERKK